MKQLLITSIFLVFTLQSFSQLFLDREPTVKSVTFNSLTKFISALQSEQITLKKADFDSREIELNNVQDKIVARDHTGLIIETNSILYGSRRNDWLLYFNYLYQINKQPNRSIVMYSDIKSNAFGFKYFDFQGSPSKYIVVVHYYDEKNDKEFLYNRECFIISTPDRPNDYQFWGIKCNHKISRIEVLQTGIGAFSLNDVMF